MSHQGCTPPYHNDYEIIGDAIPAPLTTETPDLQRGKTLFETRSDAHCVLCHMHSGTDVAFQGNMGPDLTYVSERFTPAQIRLRLVDYEHVQPGTTMPSFYKRDDLHQVHPDHLDQTLLTALEIEDIISFLIDYDDSSHTDTP